MQSRAPIATCISNAAATTGCGGSTRLVSGTATTAKIQGYTIAGKGTPTGGVADAGGDHRMAMSFAIAALSASGPSRIDGSDAVVISYPGFFETLERLVRGRTAPARESIVGTAFASSTPSSSTRR